MYLDEFFKILNGEDLQFEYDDIKTCVCGFEVCSCYLCPKCNKDSDTCECHCDIHDEPMCSCDCEWECLECECERQGHDECQYLGYPNLRITRNGKIYYFKLELAKAVQLNPKKYYHVLKCRLRVNTLDYFHVVDNIYHSINYYTNYKMTSKPDQIIYENHDYKVIKNWGRIRTDRIGGKKFESLCL